jgi:protein-L-isoaspartate O-methyltransferase
MMGKHGKNDKEEDQTDRQPPPPPPPPGTVDVTPTMTEPAAPLRSLVRAVEETQPLAPEWRAAFLATQRHPFIPDTVWLRDPDATTVHDLVPLHRAAAPDRWLELAYADDSIVTQVDDGRATGPDGAGYAVSSSASQPSVVAMMLAAAGFEDGMTVCEIGTGTGYNAALLGCRLGDRNVTTIEIDPELASRARNALGRAGHQIAVVTGDGALGHPPRAPYDRVLATCAVHRVPYRWVAQSSPGGRIVTPWGTSYFNGGLLSLSVDSDGTAHGRLTDTAAFMWIRDQRLPRVTVGECVHHEEDATTTYTDLHPFSRHRRTECGGCDRPAGSELQDRLQPGRRRLGRVHPLAARPGVPILGQRRLPAGRHRISRRSTRSPFALERGGSRLPPLA